MKDIALGLIIVLVCFLIGDYVYTEKNVCDVGKYGMQEEAKCGLIKEQFDININILGRYW